MDDFFIKLLKFIGFLIWIGALVFLFLLFAWGGLIVGIIISGGAMAIFGDN